MSLKDTLRSLSMQTKVTGALAVGGLSGTTNAATSQDAPNVQPAIEQVETRRPSSFSAVYLDEVLKNPTRPDQALMKALFDKELWTPDFQRGVDNLVHDFFKASPYQIQHNDKTKTHEDGSVGSLYNKLGKMYEHEGHFAQSEYKNGGALTMDMYRGNGGDVNLGEVGRRWASMPHTKMIPQERLEQMDRISVGVRHSGTDISRSSYLEYLKEHSLKAFLPPNASGLLSLVDTADSVLNSSHASTRLVGGYELDDGGKLAVSFGSVPIMEEYSSRGMIGPNEAHLMRDRFNVDQQVKNAICFDYITPKGDMHRLGYAERGKKGTIFSYDGSNGEMFYVGSKNALNDKLQFAGGARVSTALDGFEGFCSVRYKPNENTQAIFEVHGLGSNDPRCVASIQQDANNFVFGAMAAASQREQALYGTVEHKPTGWYTGVGIEHKEQPNGNTKSGASLTLGKKWDFGGR